MTRPLPQNSAEPASAIGQLLAARAQTHPDAVALLQPGLEALSYGDLQQIVGDLRRELREHGIDRRHRLALVMPNSSATALLMFALMDSCTLVPINPDYRRREYESLFARIRVDALVTTSPAQPAARASAESAGIPTIGALADSAQSGRYDE